MSIGASAALGLLAGLHAATWGAYKDSPFEGFRWSSYLRSIVLGLVIGTVVGLVPLLASPGAAVVLLGVCYAIERLATEWWKAILRVDDQTAYSIPMRLGYRGRPVDSRAVRYGVGAAVAVGLVALCSAGSALQGAVPELPRWALVLLGGTAGWLTAFGGAWKDAPVEGFSGWKFLRSPVVATAWALPLSGLTESWVGLALSAGGFAVASIETYKTFLTGDRPPGKFATKPPTYRVPAVRRVLRILHICLWGGLAVTVAAGLLVPLGEVDRLSFAAGSPHLALMLIGLLAACATALVVGTGLAKPPVSRTVDAAVLEPAEAPADAGVHHQP